MASAPRLAAGLRLQADARRSADMSVGVRPLQPILGLVAGDLLDRDRLLGEHRAAFGGDLGEALLDEDLVADLQVLLADLTVPA